MYIFIHLGSLGGIWGILEFILGTPGTILAPRRARGAKKLEKGTCPTLPYPFLGGHFLTLLEAFSARVAVQRRPELGNLRFVLGLVSRYIFSLFFYDFG